MELMVSVAIVGLLAAIAIPNFVSYQARARRSEAFANLTSLARAQKSYQAENDSFIDSGTTAAVTLPDYPSYGGLGTTKMPWDAASSGFFDQVGWAPEGQVFYTYESNASLTGASGCTCTLCFTLAAHGDVDGDGMIGRVVYVHPETDSTGTVVGSCPTYLGTLGTPVRTTGAVYNEPVAHTTGDNF